MGGKNSRFYSIPIAKPPPPPPPSNEPSEEEVRSITQVFNNFIKKKADYANNQISQVQAIFRNLGNTTNDEIVDLQKDISIENDKIDTQIITNNALLNESGVVKFHYGKKELDILKYQNTILFGIFYILVIVLGVIMFYYNNINLILQTIVFHVLLVYPFIIYYLELSLFIIYKYTYSYLFSIPYEKVYVGFG